MARRAPTAMATRAFPSVLRCTVGSDAEGCDLRCVECQGEVGNEVVWMFDADRQSDRCIENTNALAYLGRYARMGHGCRMRGQGFRSAEADGKLEDLQRVEKPERGRLAALDIE